MSEQNKDLQMLDKAITTLGEHFDTVQIFCTRHESGTQNGTVGVKRGVGNWFARYGQVREWMLIEEEDSRLKLKNSEGI